MTEILVALKTFYQENFILSFYFIFLLIFLIMEISFLLKSNWIIYKIKKKLKRRNFKKDSLLTQIKEDYKKLIKVTNNNIDSYTLIKEKLENKEKRIFRGLTFIENSASLYILLGFFGVLFIIAGSLLNTEFTGFDSLSNIYSNLDKMIITIIFTLICSFIIKIICYILNTGEKIDSLIEDIRDYLETEIKPYTYNKNAELGIIHELMKKIESRLSDLEHTIARGFSELACDKEGIKNNNDLKILHTADIHIGLEFNEFSKDKNRKLTQARFEVLERLIDIANREGCNLFVIAGDLFESIDIEDKDIFRVINIIKSFKGQAVLILPGNHDYYSNNKLWETIIDNVSKNIIVLNKYKPYRLNELGVAATVYPAYCDNRDNKENRLEWIKNIKKRNDDNIWEIGIAHGSLKNKFPDRGYNYFVMSEKELEEIDMDLWLLGHTHEPYPDPGIITDEKIFNPGTPEPDSTNRENPGNAWIINITSDKKIYARSLKIGKYKDLIED